MSAGITSNNSLRVMCSDGIVRTATYRGIDSPTGRAFVRVKTSSGVKTVTGRVRTLPPTLMGDDQHIFEPDEGLANTHLLDWGIRNALS